MQIRTLPLDIETYGQREIRPFQCPFLATYSGHLKWKVQLRYAQITSWPPEQVDCLVALPQ